MLQLLRSADYLVLSSHAEGISNAALEAMALGLPVVTTKAGGMAEAVSDGVEGYVVPVRDNRPWLIVSKYYLPILTNESEWVARPDPELEADFSQSPGQSV